MHRMPAAPIDWNVVANVNDGYYKDAKRLLRPFGTVAQTDYYNVIVVRVANTLEFADELATLTQINPHVLVKIARIEPAQKTFTFRDTPDFERMTNEAIAEWLPALAGTSFHARVHRRGFKGLLSAATEERRINEYILAQNEIKGAPGRVDFADPDYVLDVECVDSRAGLSLWNREELSRFKFLRLD